MKGIMIVLSILFILFIFTGCINRNIADFKGNWIMCLCSVASFSALAFVVDRIGESGRINKGEQE